MEILDEDIRITPSFTTNFTDLIAQHSTLDCRIKQLIPNLLISTLELIKGLVTERNQVLFINRNNNQSGYTLYYNELIELCRQITEYSSTKELQLSQDLIRKILQLYSSIKEII